MKKNFIISIEEDVREIWLKPYYLSGEDKRNTIDIFNNFLENINTEQDETIIERELNTMASAIKNNVKRNQKCDEHEKEIVEMINNLLENIDVGESFTINSICELNWNYGNTHLFNTVVKRLEKLGMLSEKRMTMKKDCNIYVKVYTRIR